MTEKYEYPGAYGDVDVSGNHTMWGVFGFILRELDGIALFLSAL
jgi:hypothetical protein